MISVNESSLSTSLAITFFIVLLVTVMLVDVVFALCIYLADVHDKHCVNRQTKILITKQKNLRSTSARLEGNQNRGDFNIGG